MKSAIVNLDLDHKHYDECNSDLSKQDQINIEKKWSLIMKRLKAELGDDVCNSWFSGIRAESFDNEIIYLSVATRFLKNWLETHYFDNLVSHWRHEIKQFDDIQIVIRDMKTNLRNPQSKKPNQDSKNSFHKTLKTSSEASHTAEKTDDNPNNGDINGISDIGAILDPRFTFENFIVCETNQLAHAAAKQVAMGSDDAVNFYNPLYIHSSVGLGKTHLLHSIAHLSRKQKKLRVLYLTAERFMYRFISALNSQSAMAFKDQLASVDILMIDDIQFLQGPVVIREFSHLLNTMINAGRQVVVVADCLPNGLQNLDDRSRSRLSGGFVTEIGALDRNARYEILKRRAEYLSKKSLFQIDDDVLEYVASAVTSNGRELDGALSRLIGRHRLIQTNITVDMARNIIQDLVTFGSPRTVKIDEIQKLIAKHFNIPKQDLLSARRSRSIVRPRQVAMYLSKVLTLRSLPEIGRRFGGRDHTTVLHAVRKIEELRLDNPEFANEIDNLRRMLEE